MNSKTNKAAAIREYQALDPKASPKEVAAAIGCDVTYVYLVNSKERSKVSKKPKKPKVTRGQEVLRQELTQHDLLIADKNKTIVVLHEEVARLNIIIQWLEGRLRGTSV